MRMFLALALACRKEPTGDDKGTTPPHSTPTDGVTLHSGTVPPPEHTGTTGVTGHTGSEMLHTAVEEFDCATVPTAPVSVRLDVTGARGYHGLAFDQNGSIFGQDQNGNIITADFYGASNVFLPNLYSQAMDTLPTGELVIARQNGGVAVVDPVTASNHVIASSINGIYGLVVGPDLMLYAGDRQNVYRIDPVNDTSSVWIPNCGAQSVGFSPDGSTFYFTTTSGYAVWEVPLDKKGEPMGPPQRLADWAGSYRDGLAIDVCGNLYVPDYGVTKLYRIDPAGNLQMYADFGSLANYGHGAMFGSGLGGWLSDAIYLPQPYDGHKVMEIVVGVPGAMGP